MAIAARSSSRASCHFCWAKSSCAFSTRSSASCQSFIFVGSRGNLGSVVSLLKQWNYRSARKEFGNRQKGFELWAGGPTKEEKICRNKLNSVSRQSLRGRGFEVILR